MGLFSALLLATVFQINPFPMDQSPLQGAVMIRGRAVDKVGRGQPNVTVFAVSASDSATAVTDAKGNFYFLNLLPGNYTLAANTPKAVILDYLRLTGGRPGSYCRDSTTENAELAAGFEYGVTLWLLAEKCVPTPFSS